jgi:hypothetical protein
MYSPPCSRNKHWIWYIAPSINYWILDLQNQLRHMKEFLLDETSNIHIFVTNLTSSLPESSARQLRTTAPRSTPPQDWNSATTQLSTVPPTCYVRPLTFYSLAVSLLTTRFNIKKILHGARFALSVFCSDLRIERDFGFIYHKLIGFYNRGGKCLLRGTDWFLM